MITVDYLENQRAGTATDHLRFLLRTKPPTRFLPIANSLKTVNVSVSRTARLALTALVPEDRKAIELSIHHLKVSPPFSLAELNDPTFARMRRTYLHNVMDLAMLISVVGHELTVEDIFLRSRLPRIIGEMNKDEDISHA